jgi:glycerophosphoryl diester phosphodiesterase
MPATTMRPRLYGHRGAAAERPENTLEAFDLALARGADALEMDVHMTRDGELVVAHDPDGARMCDRPSELRRSLALDVTAWDAGWGFRDAAGGRPFRAAGYHIPTLERVLRTFPDCVVNLDIKQRAPAMVAPLLDLLRRERAEHRVTLASFSLRTMLEVRGRGYPGATALSGPEVLALAALPRVAWRLLPSTGLAAQVPLRHGRVRFDTRAFVERCHAVGLRVDYWVVNDLATAERLLALGADGVMSDDPGAIAPAFGRAATEVG